MQFLNINLLICPGVLIVVLQIVKKSRYTKGFKKYCDLLKYQFDIIKTVIDAIDSVNLCTGNHSNMYFTFFKIGSYNKAILKLTQCIYCDYINSFFTLSICYCQLVFTFWASQNFKQKHIPFTILIWLWCSLFVYKKWTSTRQSKWRWKTK